MAAALLNSGWESRFAAWLLVAEWPAFSGIAALSAHLVARAFPAEVPAALRRGAAVLYAGVAVAVAGPLLLQAEIFRPGGGLRMAALAASVSLAAVLLAVGPLALPWTARHRAVLGALEALLLVPLAVWCLTADAPPAWFGALLAGLGGVGLTDSLAPPPGSPRAVRGVASVFVLVVGVALFWLAGE